MWKIDCQQYYYKLKFEIQIWIFFDIINNSMKKTTCLVILVLLLTLSNSRLANPFNDWIDTHWGNCCNTHHVVSVDVSGSMYWWQSSVNSMLSTWKTYLQNERTRRNIVVSAHQFHHSNLIWPNNPKPVISKAPIDWNGPYSGATGGTTWSHGINFLIDRMNAAQFDDICYTMITDQHPSNIYVNPTTSSNFIRAYRRWRQKQCSICIRILDVRGIPRNQRFSASAKVAPNSNEELQRNAPTILSDMFNSAGVQYTYEQLNSVNEMSQYHECCRPRFNYGCIGPRCLATP